MKHIKKLKSTIRYVIKDEILTLPADFTLKKTKSLRINITRFTVRLDLWEMNLLWSLPLSDSLLPSYLVSAKTITSTECQAS